MFVCKHTLPNQAIIIYAPNERDYLHDCPRLKHTSRLLRNLHIQLTRLQISATFFPDRLQDPHPLLFPQLSENFLTRLLQKNVNESDTN
jgi:hypothetical protein